MIEIVITAVLSSLLAGVLGYTVAVVKRDTAIALLAKDAEDFSKKFDRIDRHIKIIFRLILDIARKSGVDIRTTDAVEIATLGEG